MGGLLVPKPLEGESGRCPENTQLSILSIGTDDIRT